MTNFKKIKLRVTTGFCALILACFANVALGDTKSDALFWPATNFSGSLFGTKNILYTLFIQDRYNISQEEQERTRFEGALGYRFNPQFVVWAGYVYFLENWSAVPNRRVYFQQLGWDVTSKGPILINFRTRMEERTIIGSSQYAYTFRERLFVVFPKGFTKRLSPILSDEIFYNLNQPWWLPQRGLEQNRAFIGIRVLVNKHMDFDVGYQNQYVWGPVHDFDNHIALVNWNINYDLI